MLLDLTEIFEKDGFSKDFLISPSTSEIRIQKDFCQVKTAKDFVLHVSNLGVGKIQMNAECDFELVMNCDRCLKEVIAPQHFLIERVAISAENGRDADDENLDVFEKNQLDVDALINNEILLNLPEKVLCKPDCKGLCLKCGTDLNERDCGCDSFIPDPRMAAIKDIFNAKREV